MGGVFKIKLCRPLDPIEFQKRFCNDFAPDFDASSAPFVSIGRLQTALGTVPGLQAALFGTTWDARDIGQKSTSSGGPIWSLPGPPKVSI